MHSGDWVSGPRKSSRRTSFRRRVCNGAISNPTIQKCLNPNFPSAALGTYGDSGRNILFGPGFMNMNTSLAKDFKLRNDHDLRNSPPPLEKRRLGMWDPAWPATR